MLLLVPLAAVRADAATAPAVPVHYGGDPQTDACATLAEVVGLDPKGDNFLSVRSGPGGTPYSEVDRIHTGQRLLVCEEKGTWLGVVYARSDDGAACGVASPQPRARAYAGPCRSGWVHRRYARVIAG